LAAHPRVVGIGESGLDFHYDHSPRDVQERVFRSHIAASRASGLPLIVHAREADAEIAGILREEGASSGVLHCFSSGRALAEAALELGFYISISGIVTFRNAEDLRAIVRDVPLDRLLVETDAPYLAPVAYRGRALLIDTSPDLREQLLDAGISRLDAVLLTHAHADHLHGIDDLRMVSQLAGHAIPFYASGPALGEAERRFGYAFKPVTPGRPVYRPALTPQE